MVEKSEKNDFYSELYVNPDSERFVKKIWVLDNSKNEYPVENKLILPNGCFNISIVKGNGLDVYINQECYEMNEGIHLCSQMTNSVLINITPFTKIVLVQMHAWTPSLLYNLDIKNFEDTIEEIDYQSLPLKHKITPEIYSEEEKILEIVNKNCEEFISKVPKSQSFIEKVCKTIQLNKGDVIVTRLAEDMHCSIRTMQLKFKQAVGISVKEYIKIVKFRNTVDEMVYSDIENLTKVAIENNYYDQSHFISIFKKIAKITPKKFNPKQYILSHKLK